MQKTFSTLLLFIFLFANRNMKAQSCLTPGNLLTGKGIPMFMKSMDANRIVTGGVYYTASQGVMTLGGDTLHPRTGDVLTIFAAVLDSNLNLLRLFNVIGFTESGGAFNDTRVWDMHADAGGNIYFCGSYTQDTLLSYFGDTVLSDTYQEAFVVRCDTMGATTLLKSCGSRQWNTNFKFEDRAQAITSDAQGNIIFTVSSEGIYFEINGDTANSTTTFSNVSYSDIFIVSLFPNGNTRWIRNCGTIGKDDAAYDVSANAQGEVAVCGGLNASNSVFHFGSITHTFRYSQYGIQGFVGKLDSSGVPLWLSPIEVYYPSGPDVGAYATAIDDSGYVYSSGYFDAWAIFNGDTIRSLFYTNNYFAKYNLSGQTQFVKLGNIDTFYPFPIYMDLNKGKVLITGQCYTNQLTFQQYGQCCSTEAYVVLYNTQGEVQWLRGAKSINSSNPYFGMGCLNTNGTAYVCGTGGGGTVELSPLLIPITGNAQYFIVKFAPAPSNGLSLSIANAGNDTLICGAGSQLIPTLVPASGPKLTWWADNDTISLPNFAINLTASPKQNTLYIATAFFNGCVVSDSVLLYVEPLPCFAGSDTLICEGQPLTLVGNTLAGATYQWIPASAVSSNTSAQTQFIATNSTLLSYKVTRSGCSTIDSVSIQVFAEPASNFSFSNTLLSVSFLNSSVGYDSLRWDFGDGYYSTTTSPTHNYAQNGIYTACLHTYTFCGADSLCMNINLSTVGITEPENSTKIVRLESGYKLTENHMIGAYTLYDIGGRAILSGTEISNTLLLDFTALVAGSYILKFENKEATRLFKLMW